MQIPSFTSLQKAPCDGMGSSGISLYPRWDRQTSSHGHQGGPALDGVPLQHCSNVRIPGEIWGKEKTNQPKKKTPRALEWVLAKWLSPREHETDSLAGSASGGRQSHQATLLFSHFLWRYILGCPPLAPLLLIIPLRPSAFCSWRELVSSTSTGADYLQPHTLQATPVASRHSFPPAVILAISK